jgi:hypothetical protein
MLTLTTQELDDAATAIKNHGYGDFFPEPPEWALVESKWIDIRNELSKIDLDLYQGHDTMFAFAPKSRLNLYSNFE